MKVDSTTRKEKEQAMNTRHTLIIGLALVLTAGIARAQGGHSTKGGSIAVVRTPTLTALVASHDDLSARFRRLATAAINPTSTAVERQAFGRFVRSDVLSRLSTEVSVLYPTFDSLVGGGYAVPAVLFDVDGISFLTKEVERTASGSDRVEFVSRAYALSAALESYFTKTELLVLPVLEERLDLVRLNEVFNSVERRAIR
jgi:hypothetical protein